MKAAVEAKGRGRNAARNAAKKAARRRRVVPPPSVTQGDVLRLAHIVKARRKDGGLRWYIYAWRYGPPIGTVDADAKPTLGDRERHAIVKAIAAARAPRREERTLSWLIAQWTGWGRAEGASPEWQALSASTRRTWSSALRLIEHKWGKVPLRVISDHRMVEKIYQWRDSRAHTPRAADTGVQVLRSLLSFGRPYGVLRNTAAGIRSIYRNGSRADIIWLPDDITRFEEGARALGMPSVALAIRLACATGLRRADLISLTEAQVKKFRLLKRTQKTSRRRQRTWVSIPRLPSLDALLEELRELQRCEGVKTLLVDEEGKPWDGDTLTRMIKKVCDLQGIKQVCGEKGEAQRKHLHDCRGTFATHLMVEGGLSDPEIADILGWSKANVANIRKLYVDGDAHAFAIGARIHAAALRE